MGIYKDLEGKRVVITGGASGIGLATAIRFIEEGARVVIFDWNQDALNKTLSELPKLGGGVLADVGNPDDIDAAFQKVDDLLGGIDILISNAGISARKSFLEIAHVEWTEMLRVNLDGMYLCAKQAIKRMQVQRSGVILMTSSTNGMEGHQFYAGYNASKAGVIILAKTLALEFAPWIRVNAICPGYVLTPMQKAEYTPEMLEEVNSGIPMKRHAKPEEVAALFAFLSSNEASYLTGIAVPVDGGETAGPYLVEK